MSGPADSSPTPWEAAAGAVGGVGGMAPTYDGTALRTSDMEAARQRLSRDAGVGLMLYAGAPEPSETEKSQRVRELLAELGLRWWELSPLPFPAPRELFGAAVRAGRLSPEVLDAGAGSEWTTAQNVERYRQEDLRTYGAAPDVEDPERFLAERLAAVARLKHARRILNDSRIDVPAEAELRWATAVRDAARLERTGRDAGVDAQWARDGYDSDGPSIAASVALFGAAGAVTGAAADSPLLAWASVGTAGALALAALLVPIARRRGLDATEQATRTPAWQAREQLEHLLRSGPGGLAR